MSNYKNPCFRLTLAPAGLSGFILCFFTFLFLSASSFSQTFFQVKFINQADVKVYEVEFENQADLMVYKVDYSNQADACEGKWYFAEFENQADHKIFFTEFPNQADLKIFYVKFPNRAGWRNEDKKHLLCKSK